jgi:hypothetical protein
MRNTRAAAERPSKRSRCLTAGRPANVRVEGASMWSATMAVPIEAIVVRVDAHTLLLPLVLVLALVVGRVVDAAARARRRSRALRVVVRSSSIARRAA